VKISQRLKTLVDAAERFWRSSSVAAIDYPQTVVDLVVFHKLHFHMSPQDAWQCFSRLKDEFVDWNEVRVSVVREIQEQLSGANDSLELAVFIKDFLEHVHKERRRVTLEPLVEANLTDFRRFFKTVKGLDPATVEFVLMRTKAHPVVPLSASMERHLAEIGIVKSADTRDRKAKHLFEAVGQETALHLHHYLLFHTHANSRPDGTVRLPAPMVAGGGGRASLARTNAAAASVAATGGSATGGSASRGSASRGSASRGSVSRAATPAARPHATKAAAGKKSSRPATRKVVRKPSATKRVRATSSAGAKTTPGSKSSRGGGASSAQRAAAQDPMPNTRPKSSRPKARRKR